MNALTIVLASAAALWLGYHFYGRLVARRVYGAGDLPDEQVPSRSREDGVDFVPHPIFGVDVPTTVPGVPSEVLSPRDTWADPDAYDAAAGKLAEMFRENFEQFADQVSEEVKTAGPR